MSQITYTNKVALNPNSDVLDINKVNDTDMNEIKTVVNTNTPVGSIQIYAGSTAPSGWLICDGSAISRTTYANLYAVIGTTYGVGDGSTTFNLPNLKGKVVVGQDTSDVAFDVIGETGGAKNVTLTIDQIPSHTHTPAVTITGNSDGYQPGSQWTEGVYTKSTQGTTLSLNNTGGGSAHNNLQPYMVMNYIISY